MRVVSVMALLVENWRRLAAYARNNAWIILQLRNLLPRNVLLLPISTVTMPARSPELADQMRAFEERCRTSGFPLTVQRRVILECVLQRHDHPTADQVHEEVRVRVPEISRTTVYRTLEAFVQMGAIRRAHYLGPASRFDSNVGHHHHIVCIRCNAVVDFEDDRLDDLPVPEPKSTAFRIMDYSVHYAGVCATCQDAEVQAADRP